MKNLYRADIAINSQASSVRVTAVKQAMQAVLLKVGGQHSVLTQPLLKQAVNRANKFLKQYRYITEKNQLKIQVSFDEHKINQLFQQAELPIWGNLRPQTLLWLVDEQQFSRRLVGENGNEQYVAQVYQFADQRGLPIRLPIIDLQQAQQIDIADVWGRFQQPILAYSSTYQAESVAVIRLSDYSLLQTIDDTTDSCPLCQEQVVGDITLFNQQTETQQHISFTANNKAEVLKQALLALSEQVFIRYAQQSNDRNKLQIDVLNIASLADYQKVTDFLTKLSSVVNVSLLQRNAQGFRFSILVSGEASKLLAALKLNKQLTQKIDPLASIEQQAIPQFLWNSHE